ITTYLIFFFQAEDGIRYRNVTGVQTCALPIWGTTLKKSILRILDRLNPKAIIVVSSAPQIRYPDCYGIDMARLEDLIAFRAALKIGRASCREKVEGDVVDVRWRENNEM